MSSKPTNSIEEQGYHVYKMFEKVVKWTVNHRVQGLQPEHTHFRSLLLHLRKGESILDDWKLLLTRQPSNVANLSQFDDAARLYYSNIDVENYNHEELTRLLQPVAQINALSIMELY